MRHRHIEKPPAGHGLWRFALIGVFLFKLDGYRALAIKAGRQLQLGYCNDKDLSGRLPGVVAGPGRAVQRHRDLRRSGSAGSFGQTVLQYTPELCCRSSNLHYAFDLLILKGRDLRSKPVTEHRELLRSEGPFEAG
jgi:hypothetical protein